MAGCSAYVEFGLAVLGEGYVRFRCRLPEGHEGMHKEQGDAYGQLYLMMFADNPDPFIPPDDGTIWDYDLPL